jgi:hypothetical protein
MPLSKPTSVISTHHTTASGPCHSAKPHDCDGRSTAADWFPTGDDRAGGRVITTNDRLNPLPFHLKPQHCLHLVTLDGSRLIPGPSLSCRLVTFEAQGALSPPRFVLRHADQPKVTQSDCICP